MTNFIQKLLHSKEISILKKENDRLQKELNELKLKSQAVVDKTNKYYKNILKKHNIRIS